MTTNKEAYLADTLADLNKLKRQLTAMAPQAPSPEIRQKLANLQVRIDQLQKQLDGMARFHDDTVAMKDQLETRQ